MPQKGQRGLLRPQPFASALLATLAVQFKLVHGSKLLSNNDAVDVLEALVVSRCEPIEGVRSGLEGVGLS